MINNKWLWQQEIVDTLLTHYQKVSESTTSRVGEIKRDTHDIKREVKRVMSHTRLSPSLCNNGRGLGMRLKVKYKQKILSIPCQCNTESYSVYSNVPHL